MADIGKILEAEEYCLTNGKCTECKFSKGRMFATCRYLMEDIFKLLKEQPQIVRCKDCKRSGGRGRGIYCQFIECENTGTFHKDDWFCADGERKESR